MNRNEKLMLGLAGGLMMAVVARQFVATNGRALGLSPAELAVLGLAASVVLTPLVAKGGRR